MSSEALRLDDELQRLADDGPALIHLQSGSYICQKLGEGASLLRTQAAGIAELEAERDQLRAEVERLRPNATRYEWLRDVNPASVPFDSLVEPWVFSRPAASASAIDRAIEAAKEA